MQVAALFVRRDSIYKTMPEVDAWDADRDALQSGDFSHWMPTGLVRPEPPADGGE